MKESIFIWRKANYLESQIYKPGYFHETLKCDPCSRYQSIPRRGSGEEADENIDIICYETRNGLTEPVSVRKEGFRKCNGERKGGKDFRYLYDIHVRTNSCALVSGLAMVTSIGNKLGISGPFPSYSFRTFHFDKGGERRFCNQHFSYFIEHLFSHSRHPR